MIEYSNSEIASVIDEYIHKAKYRDILKARYITGMTFEEIAEKHGMSDRQIKNIVYKHENIIFSHLKK